LQARLCDKELIANEGKRMLRLMQLQSNPYNGSDIPVTSQQLEGRPGIFSF
jgi:hypothetical protein